MIKVVKSRSLAVVGLLLAVVSLFGGLFYQVRLAMRPAGISVSPPESASKKVPSKEFPGLTERVSEDGYGYVIEKIGAPTEREKEYGRQALRQWLRTRGQDRCQRAYEIVNGKALYGMNGIEVLYAMGGPKKSKDDGKYKRYKYSAADASHQSCELYVTFDGEKEPKVVYSCLFLGAEDRESGPFPR